MPCIIKPKFITPVQSLPLQTGQISFTINPIHYLQYNENIKIGLVYKVLGIFYLLILSPLLFAKFFVVRKTSKKHFSNKKFKPRLLLKIIINCAKKNKSILFHSLQQNQREMNEKKKNRIKHET
jgi:hypothetical protein